MRSKERMICEAIVRFYGLRKGHIAKVDTAKD
jgi:hypothetical protein